MLDIRLRPNNPVFEKVGSQNNSNTRPPWLWLVTMGSIEMRAAQYMENDTTQRERWDNEWWCDEPGYYDLVWKSNTWPTEQEATAQRGHIVQSVMRWIKSGFVGEFQYVQRAPSPQNDTINRAPSPAIHIAGPSTPPLPPTTPTATVDTTTTQVKQVSCKIIHHLERKKLNQFILVIPISSHVSNQDIITSSAICWWRR